MSWLWVILFLVGPRTFLVHFMALDHFFLGWAEDFSSTFHVCRSFPSLSSFNNVCMNILLPLHTYESMYPLLHEKIIYSQNMQQEKLLTFSWHLIGYLIFCCCPSRDFVHQKDVVLESLRLIFPSRGDLVLGAPSAQIGWEVLVLLFDAWFPD